MGAGARLGVRGWVRNRADGSVEALVIGAEDAVSAMIEACRQGPPAAAVAAVAAAEDEDDGSAGFAAHPTA
jgi:acylphosphatase